MNLVVEIITGIAILLGLIYTIMIGMFCVGWMMTKPKFDSAKEDVFVSIIIPVRDEEDTIDMVLDDLIIQGYDKTMFEIIIVDDGSTDETVEVIKDFFDTENNIKVIVNNGSGKKDAITTAMKIAKGELIITTDADCSRGENWIQDIVYFYRETHAKMIVSPVFIEYDTPLFSKMQSLEFMSLVASGGGALYFENAILCNGANLAYTKQVWEEVNGFEGVEQTATGDDVLLMYKIKEKYPDGIKFLKSLSATVITEAKPTLKEFFNQRKRWASKPFGMLNTETKIVSLVVYFFSFFILLLLDIGCFYPNINFFEYPVIKICILLFVVKCVIDFLLLLLATIFFEEKKLLIWFLPMQIIYLFYVVITGFSGLSKKYEWKGRIINEK